MKRIGPKALASMSGWQIAEAIGCHYTGDASPIPHGGAFYNTDDWTEFGYANCVRIEEVEGRIVVECGTINRASDCTPEAIRDCFGGEIDITPDVEIDWCLGQWGMETQEDFGGPYVQSFPEDGPEWKVWRAIRGWLDGLKMNCTLTL